MVGPGVRQREAVGVENLTKADAIVRAIERNGEMSVQGLAEMVREPVSSTYRLVSSLLALGWVEPAPRRGLYRLGLYFMRIGGVCEDGLDLREAARPQMDALRAQTRASCLLWVRRGVRAACIERMEGRDLRFLTVRLGDSLPLYSGAGPRALLANLPGGERGALLDEFERLGSTDSSIPLRSTVEYRIRQDLERGFSVSGGEQVTEVGIAAPVFNHRGELEASISVRGLRHQLPDQAGDTARLVVAAAKAVSEALGSIPTEASHG